MVLYRLLNGLPSDSYCLISRENYEFCSNNNRGDTRLPGKYYSLKPVFQLPALKFLKLSLLSSLINAIIGVYSRAKQIEKIIRREHCRLLIACTGDLYDLPAAYLACQWTKITFALYIFDDYVYQWTGFYRFIAKRLGPIILKNAKGIIVPNEQMKEEYLKRFGVQSTVIHNPCHLPNLDELDKADSVFDKNEINIVYTGAVYHAHYDAFGNLIAAIKHFNKHNVKLHIYTAQPELELRQNGISGPMVLYHPHINQAEVAKILRQADILFLPLAFESPIPEVIRTSMPGKTGEYLSVGRPILVHAPNDSCISTFFKKNECGVVVDKKDPATLSDAIERIISDVDFQTGLNKRARYQAEKHFDIVQIQSRFIDFLCSIT